MTRDFACIKKKIFQRKIIFEKCRAGEWCENFTLRQFDFAREKKYILGFFYFVNRNFFHRKKIFPRKIFFKNANKRRGEKYFFFLRRVRILRAVCKKFFAFVHKAKCLGGIEFYCVQFHSPQIFSVLEM